MFYCGRDLWGFGEERETAGSLAALGMTTRKATAKATATTKAKAKYRGPSLRSG